MRNQYTKTGARYVTSKFVWALYELKIVQLNWGNSNDRQDLIEARGGKIWFTTFRVWNPLAWPFIVLFTLFLGVEICTGTRAIYRRAPK